MKRFPDKNNLLTSALVTLAIVNTWAFGVFLYTAPGLIKQLTVTEVLAILSYILFSALVESLMIFLFLTVLSALLPVKLLRLDFSVRSGIFLLLSTIYIIPFHVYIPRITSLVFEAFVSIFIIAWTILYLVELVLFHFVIQQYDNFKTKAELILDRMTVLGGMYLFFDLLGLGYVIIANWS